MGLRTLTSDTLYLTEIFSTFTHPCVDLFTGLAQSYGHILFMHRVIKNTVWKPKVSVT